MAKTKFKNKTQQQYIVYDSRANYDEDAATVLECFSDRDDAAAMKYAKKEWPDQLAVLYRNNRGGDTTYVGVVK